MSEAHSFKCPNCGGPLHFDPKEQKLKCNACGNIYAIDQIPEPAAETAHLQTYTCPDCGAELVCDDTTAASSCPYCGNPNVIASQVSGMLKPDYVIPFQLEKQDAINKLNDFYKGKPFLPKPFKEQNHIEEIKGVYVPFWLYSANIRIDASYQGTRSFSTQTANEIITHTDHYSVQRGGTTQFEKIPADASTRLPDEYMDALEPFSYNKLVPFHMNYLPGFYADKYDVDKDQDAKRVNSRMDSTIRSQVHQTIIGYAGIFPERENVNIESEKAEYAFLPVYLLSTRWRGRNYLFAMNGETGKIVGDMPVDWGKFWLTFLLITVIGMVVLYIVLLA